ncbi:MAG: TIGR03808 family TAT-translocated repetitive protein [Pseudomonadota bacterium]
MDLPDASRRAVLGSGLLTAAALTAGPTKPAAATTRAERAASAPFRAITEFGVTVASRDADDAPDQSRAVSRAIAETAKTGTPLLFPPGRYRLADISLPDHAHLIGVAGQSIIEFAGGPALFAIRGARDVHLEGLALDGRRRPFVTRNNRRPTGALIQGEGAFQLELRDLAVANSLVNGIALEGCHARIDRCTITDCGDTAIFTRNGRDSRIENNRIERCGNNGIRVWRSEKGEDGTIVVNNIVRRIADRAGGTGQNGNGINIFRADAVQVLNNRITDCAFTAIRGNAASDIQMVANHCLRLGEVALYAEFGFDGALIANNLIDGAATGISVTNFNDGGRLAVVQGNLIRNLALRDDPDARGIGIGVEADTAVTGNVIENAPTVGLAIGWGRYMRNVTATGNLIRRAGIGIGITGVKGAGTVFVTNNMLTETPGGAIRTMDHARAFGPDLARADAGPRSNFTVFGNVSS